MRLSIIVPAYNVEKYIARCLDSLLAQTFSDFECIIIDDGSKDGTLGICQEYQEREHRIRVYHIENQGVSYARNLGMTYAKGEYITFVDGDDYVEKDTYRSIFIDASYKEYEVFCFGLKKLFDLKCEHIPFQNVNLQYNFIHYDVFMHGVCNKVFRKKFLIDYGIQFDVGIEICEDMLVAFRALALASKVKYIEEDFYCYCDNEKSVSHSKMSQKNLADYKKVSQLVEEFCITHGLEKKYKKFINYRLMYYAVIYLTSIEYYNPTMYRQENPRKHIWRYTFRPELFFITLCSNLHFDLPARIYIKLKKRKYKNN